MSDVQTVSDVARGVGFGIVGCGVIGPWHAKAIAQNGGRVVACCDADEDKAKALADEYGATPHTALDALLADDAVDVVCVCTPSGQHAEVAVPAAAAGRHVIVEKPIEVSVDAARRIVDAGHRHGVKLTVISQHRFDDAAAYVRRAASEGRFGRLTMGDAHVTWWRSQEYYDSAGWRGTWELDGGGALMNQSIHSVDVLRYLMGDVDSVCARTATLAHTGIEVEDVAVSVLRFANGALGTIVGTTAAYPGLSARIAVHGDRGSAVIDKDELAYFHVQDDDGLGPPPAAQGSAGAGADPGGLNVEGHRRQIADMVEAIRGDRQPLITGEEGLRSLQIVLAVYESARRGGEVRLS